MFLFTRSLYTRRINTESNLQRTQSYTPAGSEPLISQIHQVRGRMRITIPPLKNQNVKLQGLCDRLESVRGLKAVTVNPVTASVVIRFDDSQATAGEFINIVRDFIGMPHLLGFPGPCRWRSAANAKPFISSPGLGLAVRVAVSFLVPVLVEKYLGRPAGKLAAALL